MILPSWFGKAKAGAFCPIFNCLVEGPGFAAFVAFALVGVAVFFVTVFFVPPAAAGFFVALVFWAITSPLRVASFTCNNYSGARVFHRLTFFSDQ